MIQTICFPQHYQLRWRRLDVPRYALLGLLRPVPNISGVPNLFCSYFFIKVLSRVVRDEKGSCVAMRALENSMRDRV
jgi:hypothetical protein